MKGRKVFFVSFIIAISIINAMSCTSPSSNKTESSLNSEDTEYIGIIKERELSDKIKSKDYSHHEGIKNALFDYFKQIYSLTSEISVERVNKLTTDNNKYFAVIKVSGTVNGKPLFGGIGDYTYSMTGNIIEDQLDKPYFFSKSVSFYEKIGKYLYYEGEVTDYYIKSTQENFDSRMRYRKDIGDSYCFIVDGIKVCYEHYKNYSYIYTTAKPLTAKQIVKAVERIAPPRATKIIQFCHGCEHFADYVYSSEGLVPSESIVFVKSGEKYNVVNGKPILRTDR